MHNNKSGKQANNSCCDSDLFGSHEKLNLSNSSKDQQLTEALQRERVLQQQLASHDSIDTAVREALAQAQAGASKAEAERSEEHTSELQSLMRISYAVFC